MKILTVKKSIFILFAIIIAIGAVCGFFSSAAAANAKGRFTVVIDAGHGGIDAGVLGVESKVKESDINLKIARYLQEYFSEAGFLAVLTRKTEGGLYGIPTKGFKMRDMKARKKIIEESNANMVISIHQNACPLKSRRGGQAFYDKSSQSGKALAESVQKALNGMDECVKIGSALVGDYYMLKCTSAPSVLVECGFLSNEQDEKLLNSNEYKRAIAYAIFKGAIAFLT
ncbi:MAG: N-acetylmuramoyl-L-alanine amidase [Clostridia bacterium]|nr:N-acetylmuramoyl-L-alanine amidase [Clostridia bacterium]